MRYMPTETPKYQHDCQFCNFLGRYAYKAQFADTLRDVEVDLYVHPCVDRRCDCQSYIARYGDAGPEYSSMPADVVEALRHLRQDEVGTYCYGLFEAYNRQQARL